MKGAKPWHGHARSFCALRLDDGQGNNVDEVQSHNEMVKNVLCVDQIRPDHVILHHCAAR